MAGYRQELTPTRRTEDNTISISEQLAVTNYNNREDYYMQQANMKEESCARVSLFMRVLR
jgi:hypothetical protein